MAFYRITYGAHVFRPEGSDSEQIVTDSRHRDARKRGLRKGPLTQWLRSIHSPHKILTSTFLEMAEFRLAGGVDEGVFQVTSGKPSWNRPSLRKAGDPPKKETQGKDVDGL